MNMKWTVLFDGLPRIEVVAFDRDSAAEQAEKLARALGHTRYYMGPAEADPLWPGNLTPGYVV